MALWMVRAGRRSEYEARFIHDGRIYLTWEELPDDLSLLNGRSDVRQLLQTLYPPSSSTWIPNHTTEISAFLFGMEPGDHVLVPRSGAKAIAVGQITGNYVYDGNGGASYRHARSVNWLNLAVPRASLDEDVVRSLKSRLTICRVGRGDAEARVLQFLRALKCKRPA